MDFSLGNNEIVDPKNPNEQNEENNFKIILQSIKNVFESSTNEIRQVITKYISNLDQNFVSELQNKLRSSQEQIVKLLSQDPKALQPTTPLHNQLRELQKQQVEWQKQKQKGFEMLDTLKKRNQHLEEQLKKNGIEIQKFEEEKHKWEQERAQGYEMMAQYQQEISSLKTNDDDETTINDLNQQNPHETILELTNELETSQFAVERLQETVDTLTQENKRLWADILALRDQNDELLKDLHKDIPSPENGNIFAKPPSQTSQEEIIRLKGIIDKGKQAYFQLQEQNNKLQQLQDETNNELTELKNLLESKGITTKKLYRSDTVTTWNQDDLDELKKEMIKEVTTMHKQELMRKMEASDLLRFDDENNQPKPNIINENEEEQPNTNSYSINVETTSTNNETTNEEDETNKKKLYRSGTKTEWDENQLQQLKSELMQEFNVMKKQQLNDFFEKQDELRMPTTNKNENENENENENNNKTNKTNNNLLTPSNLVTENLENDDQLQQLRKEMMHEMRKMNQEVIMKMAQKNDELRDPGKPGPKDNYLLNEDKIENLNENNLEQLKSELLNQLQRLTKNEISRMVEKSFELRTQEYEKRINNNNQTNNYVNSKNVSSIEPQDIEQHRTSNLVRVDTKTEWNPDDLEKLKSEMEQQIVQKQKEELARMFEGPSYQPPVQQEVEEPVYDIYQDNDEEDDDEETEKPLDGYEETNITTDGMTNDGTNIDIKSSTVYRELLEDYNKIQNKFNKQQDTVNELNQQVNVLKSQLSDQENKYKDQIQTFKRNKLLIVQSTATEIEKLRQMIFKLSKRYNQSRNSVVLNGNS